MSLDEFFVTGDPLILGSQIAIGLTMIGLLALITYLKRWKWLWNEWFTTVDHKKNWNYVHYLRCLNVFQRGS